MKWNWHGIHSDLVESIGVIYLEIIIDSNNNIMRDIGTDFPKYILSILYCHHFGWQMFIRRKWTKKKQCSPFSLLSFWSVEPFSGCVWCTICICRMNKSENEKQTQLHVLEFSKYAIYGIQSDILAKKVNNNKIRRFHNIFSTQFNIACRTRQKPTRHIQRPKRNTLHVLKGANEETKTPATAISRN